MAEDTVDLLKAILAVQQDQLEYTKNISRDIQQLRSMVTEVVNYMKNAESEVSERMRRFIMYFHDAHDVINFYHELGLQPPKWIVTEVERCADRYRHILEEEYDVEKSGTFERVRQKMTAAGGNRYNWDRLLTTKGQD